MAEHAASMDPRELEEAFSLFTEASKQLSDAYADLQQQVEFLTKQLEIANGNLRRELEEKAALSRRLTVLLEQLPGGVVEVDERNQVAAMNPAARAMLAPLQQGDDWGGFRAQVLTPTSSDDLWVYPRSQGALRLNIKESAMPAESRRILLVQDLTQSWALEQALARHQRLATMGEMAAGLAHQLRTPLATALLYAGHLAKPVLPEADRIRFGEKTLARLRHLETLIQNMLGFVRGQDMRLEAVELAQTLNEAAQTLQPQLEARNLHLNLMLPTDEILVLANRKELLGVILNLLDNAMLASPDGAAIQLALDQLAGTAVLRVSDQGSGMSPQVQERLFEPFFTTRKEGTGLGLAIVRNLVAHWGGEIAVRSAPDQGSDFTIRLPVSRNTTNV
ncbi:sensor histidine kinase [Amantichitinum ursilacus]|uniref:histidine kinase n=1 Tax=Amantichitinum ursilacus TaxID=857265 RepID=A0A0N0XIW0_9NEIS|nr:ATP-binding protein [Amantichitinum ursilacus]KPC53108.1 Sporulation kinase E [Amantichitinum ursilacus]